MRDSCSGLTNLLYVGGATYIAVLANPGTKETLPGQVVVEFCTSTGRALVIIQDKAQQLHCSVH